MADSDLASRFGGLAWWASSATCRPVAITFCCAAALREVVAAGGAPTTSYAGWPALATAGCAAGWGDGGSVRPSDVPARSAFGSSADGVRIFSAGALCTDTAEPSATAT